MAALKVFYNAATACAAKRLYGVDFTLLHLGARAALDDGHRLAAVYAVAVNGVAVKVLNRLDCWAGWAWAVVAKGQSLTLVDFAVQLDFIRLHYLLDGCADLAEPCIDTRRLHTQSHAMWELQLITLMPALVAARTALTSGSYFALKCTVHAQSIMRPVAVVKVMASAMSEKSHRSHVFQSRSCTHHQPE